MFKTRAVKTRAIRLILTCSARARGILAVIEIVVHDEARKVIHGEPASYVNRRLLYTSISTNPWRVGILVSRDPKRSKGTQIQ